MRIIYSLSPAAPAWSGEIKFPENWTAFRPGEKKSFRNQHLLHLFFSDEFPLLSHAANYAADTHSVTRKILVTQKQFSPHELIQVLESGFDDVLEWRGMQKLCEDIAGKKSRWDEIEEILDSDLITNNFAGVSHAWKNFLRSLIEASLYSGSNILLTGESGTGKEMLSRLVHSLDKRADKTKLVLLDCSTIAPELSGSEFFGHERGSYTSAVNSREGAFSLADGGTLFLDEVGELSLRMQAELLRVIQEGVYKKVGSNNWRSTSFRLVSATNRDLSQFITEKQFRADLYYRISDIALHVPPLRERPEDILPLALFFLREYYAEKKQADACPGFDKNVAALLEARNYPGNIRELRQLVRRIALRHTGSGPVSLGDVSPADRAVLREEKMNEEKISSFENLIRNEIVRGENLFGIKNLAAFLAIKVALEMESGNQRKAASRLNISTRAIQQYFRKNAELN